MATKPSSSGQTVSVDGHRIKLTSLDKVLYPATGTTKADVLAYYAEIAGFLIPHAQDRPVTRKRWVHGVGTAEKPGQVFFQKNLDETAPTWIKRYPIEHKDHTNTYALVNDVATLTWMAQMSSLELHVPQWKFGPRGKIQNPDRLVLDLDPGEGAGLPECAEVALLVRGILKEMGLDPVPVTSGSKGIHLYAALDGGQTSEEVSEVAHELARALEADHPDLVVSDMKKKLRTGKVLIDWSQNNWAKTTICPYSLRGRLKPMVAVPRTWKELGDPALEQLDYRQVLERMKRRQDPMLAMHAGHLASPEPPVVEGARPVVEGARNERVETHDRLAKYRSMRDAAKTPEPVPQDPVWAHRERPAAGTSFVIQEHHARRLHYDFRLEHDGVLVSWAVPKGLPTDSRKNNLAVQTEDHPLDYGNFEGTIPKGEYGGGEVTIWDWGSYELEKWRDGREVIVTLYGQDGGGLERAFGKGGPQVTGRRYVLFHTGGEEDSDRKNWMVHLMKDQPEAARPVPVVEEARPVVERAETERAETPAETELPAIKPMLATLGSPQDVTGEEDWAFEMKWDGVRAIVNLTPDGVRLISRNGNDVTATYPEFAEELADCVHAKTAVLDGEIVALNKQGRPDFGLLQTRMKLTKKAEVQRAAARTPVDLMLFDLLHLDGHSLLDLGYRQRREVLEAAVEPDEDGHIHVPPVIDTSLEEAIASSKELGLEGVIAKKCDSRYVAGQRAHTWVKLKNVATQDVVIAGWRPGNGRRANLIGSLLVGVNDGAGNLTYTGRVGTGFSDRDLAELTETLKKLERKTSPLDRVPEADARGARWVTPRLVGEVEFTEQTGSGKLRHPTWRGLRPDKAAADVVLETPPEAADGTAPEQPT
jgi:bifunctional non-homologous end joining protein LigD